MKCTHTHFRLGAVSVLLQTPDGCGRVVVQSECDGKPIYSVVNDTDLVRLPERRMFELRVPRWGEWYVGDKGVLTESLGISRENRWVMI